MRSSFDKGFELVIGLEGKPTDDPNDPGGFTIWGLASRWNPSVNKNTTIEQAKDIHLYKYWIPSGADEATYPLDIVLYDEAVNPQDDPTLPGGSLQELKNLNPENWQEYCLLRMQRYMRCSANRYVKGHVFRILRLAESLKERRTKPR